MPFLIIYMKIGCHVSIAGGIWNAPKNAADLGCEVFQIFTRSPQGGPAPKIDSEVVENFKNEMKRWNQANCYIHTPYYINFASIKESTRKASARVVREELERGSLVGAQYVMTHLGSSKDFSREEALRLTREGIAQVVKEYKGTAELLLEISAGSGNVIGDTFEELEYILGDVKDVGICLDTAHIFASGYDIKSSDGMTEVLTIIKKSVGIKRIKLIHANDSMVGLGEHKDRHDHIGDGKIGIEGFKNIIKAFPGVDLILETKHDKVIKDIKKLMQLRK